MDELIEFHRELLAEVQGDADALGVYTADAFLEKMKDLLDEAGEVPAMEQCHYDGSLRKPACRVDAYGWDTNGEEGVLNLVISDFSLSRDIRTNLKTDNDRLFKKLISFAQACQDAGFREQLDDTGNAFALADLIARQVRKIAKIKLIIVTNAVNGAKQTDAVAVGKVGGIPVTSSIWDLARIYRYIASGQTREDLVVDFAGAFGGGVPVLKASFDGGSLESYIAVIPGGQLAAVYDRWESRLLEANVRSFLQARGKVNRGIRDTIRDKPEMFFSYNNGLTATAESVEIEHTAGGLRLTKAFNLQIVNGGQTTASIHASRRSATMNDVFVQMKLTIVPAENAEEIVPRISEFANSQNKVNAADFFANHPFHLAIQEASRRILAPSGDGQYRESKWFYERARGQYADERGRRSESLRKKFDAEFPKSQFFSKTDLAKYENSWRRKPHTVSMGAQKNFSELAKAIGKEWTEHSDRFDDIWYRRLIAKAIIFRDLERMVPAQHWYSGGYRANIVTYAMAKLVEDADRLGKVIDLDQIWKMQRVPPQLERASLAAAMSANDVITNPIAGVRNMSEWAKKEACWSTLADRLVEYEADFVEALIDKAEASARKREEQSAKRVTNEVEAEREVVSAGGEYWQGWLDYGLSIGKLTSRDQGILCACAALPRKLPSTKQCVAAIEIRDRLDAYHQAQSAGVG